MNPQCEFVRETFHTLAQPLTALRVTVELGLLKAPHEQAAHRALEDCLPLIDRLMQDLAVFREIALDEEPPIDSCDGQSLLQSSAAEMALVAQARGIMLDLNAEPAVIVCHAPTLQRAIFVLLDEIIASAGRNRTISISLRRCEHEFLLEFRPGPPPGLRQKLCRKLIQSAGGHALASAADGISITFREGSSQHCPAATITDQRLLTSNSPASKNVRAKDIA